MNEPVVGNIQNSQIAMAFDIHGTLDPIISNTPTFIDVDLGKLIFSSLNSYKKFFISMFCLILVYQT